MTRKLRNAGLTSTGLLLIIALISVAFTTPIAGSGRPGYSDSVSCELSFDTLSLKLNGISEIDVLSAPSIALNKQAAEYANGYITRNNDLLREIQGRSAASFKTIDAVFNKYKLPVELKYLAVIESELNKKALSHVGARGVWQLMPETARILALKVNGANDERTHLYKSTVAVAKYLRDLYQLFGDWTLVIAAYNAGPAKVYEAIKRSGSRNFWKLQQYLPAETRGHVKKFISTHFYFEGKAGATTLTKEETIAYRKLMTEFVKRHNALLAEKLNTEKNNKECETAGELAIAKMTPAAGLCND